MRLLLLFPNIFIMSIAGYNLFNELEAEQTFYMPVVLHATVVLLSVFFFSLIVKSAFKVEYAENEEVQMG